MKTEHIKEIQSNEVLRKRLAKWMALHCFRNTKLEEFHDRLSNEEMKALMIDVVDHYYEFLSILFTAPSGDKIIDALKERDVVPKWNDPKSFRNSQEVLSLDRKAGRSGENGNTDE
jgi:hypothetical protein